MTTKHRETKSGRRPGEKINRAQAALDELKQIMFSASTSEEDERRFGKFEIDADSRMILDMLERDFNYAKGRFLASAGDYAQAMEVLSSLLRSYPVDSLFATKEGKPIDEAKTRVKIAVSVRDDVESILNDCDRHLNNPTEKKKKKKKKKPSVSSNNDSAGGSITSVVVDSSGGIANQSNSIAADFEDQYIVASKKAKIGERLIAFHTLLKQVLIQRFEENYLVGRIIFELRCLGATSDNIRNALRDYFRNEAEQLVYVDQRLAQLKKDWLTVVRHHKVHENMDQDRYFATLFQIGTELGDRTVTIAYFNHLRSLPSPEFFRGQIEETLRSISVKAVSLSYRSGSQDRGRNRDLGLR